MNTDIRLQLSFRTHPKTKKLRFALGNDGVMGFIYLLMFAAESRPDGNLSGMDEIDIALAADYEGDAKEFVRILLGVKYLKKIKNGYQIHGWKEHNAYAAGAKKRSELSKKAAAKRWQKQKNHDYTKQSLSKKNHADGIKQQCPISSSISSSSSITKEKTKEKTPVIPTAKQNFYDFCSQHNAADEAKDFEAVLKKKKAAFSERAWNRRINKLHTFLENGDSIKNVLAQSADSGWSDLYPDKSNGKTRPGTSRQTLRETAVERSERLEREALGI